MYILPKKKKIKKKFSTAKKIPGNFQVRYMRRFIGPVLCIHYSELKLVILTDVPVEINPYPCYYTKILHKTYFPRKGNALYCVMQAHYKKNIIAAEE